MMEPRPTRKQRLLAQMANLRPGSGKGIIPAYDAQFKDRNMNANPPPGAILNGSGPGLEERLATLESRMSNLEKHNQELKNRNTELETRLSLVESPFASRFQTPRILQHLPGFLRGATLTANPDSQISSSDIRSAIVTLQMNDTVRYNFGGKHILRKKQSCGFFRRLPPEIRTMIWKLALPDARAVKAIRPEGHLFSISKAPIPSLLHLCSEARQCALKRYTLIAAYQGQDGIEGGFYLDKSSDFVYVSCSTCHNPASANAQRGRRRNTRPVCGYTTLIRDIDQLKRVIIEWASNLPPFVSIINFFPAAEEIWIVQSAKGMSSMSAVLSDFKEVVEPYNWERGTNLLDAYMTHLNNHQYLLEEEQEINLKKLSRVEFVANTAL